MKTLSILEISGNGYKGCSFNLSSNRFFFSRSYSSRTSSFFSSSYLTDSSSLDSENNSYACPSLYGSSGNVPSLLGLSVNMWPFRTKGFLYLNALGKNSYQLYIQYAFCLVSITSTHLFSHILHSSMLFFALLTLSSRIASSKGVFKLLSCFLLNSSSDYIFMYLHPVKLPHR